MNKEMTLDDRTLENVNGGLTKEQFKMEHMSSYSQQGVRELQ